MTSQLKVDKLQGRTTAGSIVVTSEGTAVETNLQQGLCKAWINCLVTVASNIDSLNISSLDDDGTGDHGINLSNPFSNADYIAVMGQVSSNNVGNSAASCRVQCVTSRATGAVEVRSGYTDGAGEWVDDEDGSGTFYNMSLFGDLA
jgi:hypothetical protein